VATSDSAGSISANGSVNSPLAKEFGANEWLVEEMYERYLQNPQSVDKAWSVAKLGAAPALMVEPGRSIAGPSAITLYRVGTVKIIPGVGTYVAVDGGMSDNPRPVLYGAGYEAYLPERISEARPRACSVVGKHCEQGDVIVADAHLPADVRVGDLLATPATGAYGYSMASNYNMVPKPAVVFVSAGLVRAVLRRETASDLTRLDAE